MTKSEDKKLNAVSKHAWALQRHFLSIAQVICMQIYYNEREKKVYKKELIRDCKRGITEINKMIKKLEKL